MEPDIRSAGPDDIDALARLRWTMHTEDVESHESFDVFLSRFRPFAAQALSSGAWQVWVAEVESRIVANLWLQVIARVPRPDRPTATLGYLTNVFVEPLYRNAGVGSRILRQVATWSREHSIGLVVVWPSEHSVDYYRREAFEPTDALELSFED
jgi:GNAT superfamily N-acetyltransferase